MSKTQEKRARRQAEHDAFMKEKRTYQVQFLEANFNLGVQLYENNKDKMSEEEQGLIEAEMAKQQALLDNLKKEYGIE